MRLDAAGKRAGSWLRPAPPFVTSLGVAALCNLALNGPRFTRHGLDTPPTHQAFSLFLLGTLVLWAVLLLLVGLTGRTWIASASLLALSALLAYANVMKLSFRSEPLYPTDAAFVQDAGFLLDLVGPWPPLLGLGLATCLFLMVFAFVTHMRPKIRRAERVNWRFRLVAALVAFSALAYAGQFNSGGNRLRALFEASGASWRHWSQAENYVYNGFVPGFLYNLPANAMTAPPEYGEQVMLTIADRYRHQASVMNAGRSPDNLRATNIVFVLSEGFTDPTSMPGVSLSKDPIPFTRTLLRRSVSGPVLAQGYGGGTANMEFSSLTGQSIEAFQPGARLAYQSVVAGRDGYPSLVGYLETLGFRSVAIHPWHPNIYRRNAAYKALGLDEFISLTDMKNSSSVVPGHYVSDDSVFREVERIIEESHEPVIANVVTMQNHMPFSGVYPNPLKVEGDLSATEAEKVGQYARGLRHTDAALAAWIQRLSNSRERTVVVFYGDHQPPIWQSDTLFRAGELGARRTPLFVWSNSDAPETRRLPMTSPIHFMNLVFDVTEAPVPPYLALLRRLEEFFPAMSGDLLLDSNGEVMLAEDLPDEAVRLLRDYSLVQYDFSVGERFAVAEMFYDTATQSNSAG